METNFTKGEWHIRTGQTEIDIVGEYKSNKTIAVLPKKCFVSFDEMKANAKLIAVAPELLISLINAVEFIDKCPYLSEVDKPMGLEHWKNRIKKATE